MIEKYILEYDAGRESGSGDTGLQSVDGALFILHLSCVKASKVQYVFVYAHET